MFYSPPSSSLTSSFLSLFSLSLLILIFAPTADLSSLTIPFEEEEEEEEEDKEQEEMYNDIDGFDSARSGSQGRAMALPEPLDKEEDVYEVLPGEILHLPATRFPLLYLQKLLTW